MTIGRAVLTAFTVGLTSCGNPIARCESATSDCCEFDDQCLDFWGSDYPYCVDAPGEGGICAVCVDDRDCANGFTCVAHSGLGNVCAEETFFGGYTTTYYYY
jgi:hypothetical protein